MKTNFVAGLLAVVCFANVQTIEAGNTPWSEALISLNFSPAIWMSVSGYVGLETSQSSNRFSSTVWLGTGRWSLLSLHEGGESWAWYKHVGTFKAAEALKIGFVNQRYTGTGPYAECKLKWVTAWGFWLRNDFRLGGKFSF